MKSLGLDKPLFEPKEKPKKAKSEIKKRKTPVEANEDSAKAPRTTSDTVTDTGIRRSSRNAGEKNDYSAERLPRPSLPLSYFSGIKNTDNTGPLGREDGEREYDP